MRLADSYFEIGEFLELRNLNKKGDKTIAAAIQNNKEIQNLRSKINDQNNLIALQTSHQDEIGREYLNQQEILLNTQIKLLESQLEIAQHKEKQKIYKNQVFGIHELYDFFQQNPNSGIESYFKVNYFDQVCILLNNAKRNLDEFSEKDFCSKVLNLGINQFANAAIDYSDSPINKFEQTINQYEIKKAVYLEIEKKISEEAKKRDETQKSLIESNKRIIDENFLIDKVANEKAIKRRTWRIILIFLLSISLLGFFVSSDDSQPSDSSTKIIVIFSLLFAILFEVQYQKNKKKSANKEIHHSQNKSEIIDLVDKNQGSGHKLQLENLGEELEILEKRLSTLRNEINLEHPLFFEMFEKIKTTI